jgi:FkbM family methyltransferase
MCVFYQAYEPDVTAFLSRNVQPGHVVIVVGAHVGIHVLYIAKLLDRRGDVYAIEAWPDNFEALVRNIEHNAHCLLRAKALNAAICNHTGLATLSMGATDGTHHLTTKGETATCQVGCTTLDRFVSESALLPDLIVIDVEGAELRVLQGAANVLAQCRSTLLIEHHASDIRTEMEAWLNEAGYEVAPVGRRHICAKSHVAETLERHPKARAEK